jgi:hypothetical protein
MSKHSLDIEPSPRKCPRLKLKIDSLINKTPVSIPSPAMIAMAITTAITKPSNPTVITDPITPIAVIANAITLCHNCKKPCDVNRPRFQIEDDNVYLCTDCFGPETGLNTCAHCYQGLNMYSRSVCRHRAIRDVNLSDVANNGLPLHRTVYLHEECANKCAGKCTACDRICISYKTWDTWMDYCDNVGNICYFCHRGDTQHPDCSCAPHKVERLESREAVYRVVQSTAQPAAPTLRVDID